MSRPDAIDATRRSPRLPATRITGAVLLTVVVTAVVLAYWLPATSGSPVLSSRDQDRPAQSALVAATRHLPQRRQWRRRVLGLLLVLQLAILAGGGAASAFWSSTDSSNFAAAAADGLPTGSTPAGSLVNASTVAISFARARTISTSDVTSYTVRRYSSPTAPTPSATFNCSWPSGPPLSCTDTGVPAGAWYYTDSPTIAGSLWAGPESPRSAVVKTDTTAPVVTVSSVSPAPNAAGFNNTSPVTVNLAATDTGGSGVASITWWTAAGTPTVAPGGSVAVSVNGAGTSTVSYFATDNAANNSGTGTQPVKIDTTAPNTPTIAFPAGGRSYNAAGWTGTLTGAASDNPGGSGVGTTQLTIMAPSGQYWNGTAFAPGATWLTATGTSTWSYSFARPADGTYTVAARTADAAGNTGGTATNSATVDTVVPAVTITNPATPSSVTTPTLTGGYGTASGDIAAVSVQVYNGGTAVGSALNATLNTTAHTWSVATATLSAGTYTARATQVDSAGNTGTAISAAFTVTVVVPNAPVITYPTTTSIRAGSWSGAVTGTASETGGPGVQKTQLTIKSTNGQYYDGAGFSAGVTYLNATGTASWRYSIPGVAVGTYTVTATTIDLNGNAGPTTTLTVTITP